MTLRLSELLGQHDKTVLTTSHFLLHDVRWFLELVLSSICTICVSSECFCSAEDAARQLDGDGKASVEAIIRPKSSILFAFTYFETQR